MYARSERPSSAPATRLPWIEVAPGAPYFVTDRGEPWTPVGDNAALSWTEMRGLWRRRDVAAARVHLEGLAASGVTVLRMMLECAHQRHRTLERAGGRPNPHVVRFWDDMIALCEETGLRLMLTPVDTFWTWMRWKHHPWNRVHGGPLDRPDRFLTCLAARAAIKARFSFAIERWGGSGAIFAWDLWNEIHPAHGGESSAPFADFIADLSAHVRDAERRLWGRSRPQTVSIFGPELVWRPEDLNLAEQIFRHPDLDVATIHAYAEGAIDDPADTVAAAAAMGRIVASSLAEIRDGRPFLDTEHGPIHTFKDRRRTLPEAFDDEYFRHMQWAHLSAGGAGGGMRWPNRKVHSLTPGMRSAQKAMAGFLPLVDWPRLRRRNLSAELRHDRPGLIANACGDDRQAVVHLVRTDSLLPDGTLDPQAAPLSVTLTVPGLAPVPFAVTAWDTRTGRVAGRSVASPGPDGLVCTATVATDLALAIVPA